MLKPAALGFRVHSGWAAVVALSGAPPVVLLRRRIEVASGGSKQPYHTAEAMPVDQAAAYLESCRATTVEQGTRALDDVARKLNGYEIKGACILLASGRPLPDLARILASHPLIHTAEGEFYRSALRQSCAACGVAVSCIKERDVAAEAARVLNRPVDDLNRAVAGFAKHLGPPWQQDTSLPRSGPGFCWRRPPDKLRSAEWT